MFLGTYRFVLGYPACCYRNIDGSLCDLLYFFDASCNVFSLFIQTFFILFHCIGTGFVLFFTD